MQGFVTYPLSCGFYLALLAIITALAHISEKSNRKEVVFTIILLLTFFSGCRSIGVGFDTINFADKFYASVIYGVEPGFLFAMRLFGKLGSWNLFLLVVEAVTYSLIIARLWELRDVSNFTISVFSFMALYFFFSLNIFRQFLAIAIIFWATRYLFRCRYFVFCAWIILAMLVHKTSALGFLFLCVAPLYGKEMSYTQRSMLSAAMLLSPLVLAGCCYFFFSSSLFSSYYSYLEPQSNNNTGLMTIFKLGSVIVMLYYSWSGLRKECVLGKTLPLIASVIIISVFGIALCSLNVVSPYLNRIGLYFSFFEIVLYGLLFKVIRKEDRCIVIALVGFICFITFFRALGGNGQGMLPYSLFFL